MAGRPRGTPKPVYHAVPERDGRMWLVRVPELGRVTACARLDDVEAQVRDLVLLLSGAAEVTVVVEPVAGIPEVDRARTLRAEAEAAAEAARSSTAATVRALRRAGHTHADIAAMLGISTGRVRQIAARAR